MNRTCRTVFRSFFRMRSSVPRADQARSHSRLSATCHAPKASVKVSLWTWTQVKVSIPEAHEKTSSATVQHSSATPKYAALILIRPRNRMQDPHGADHRSPLSHIGPLLIYSNINQPAPKKRDRIVEMIKSKNRPITHQRYVRTANPS